MKVHELIAELQAMPPEAEVIYIACSDNNILEAWEIKLIKAEDEKICLRAGRYIDYIESHWGRGKHPFPNPIKEDPVFATVVQLPGN